MDWLFSLAIVFIGALVVLFIVLDGKRKKKAARRSSLAENAAQDRDPSGFDIDGIGEVRIRGGASADSSSESPDPASGQISADYDPNVDNPDEILLGESISASRFEHVEPEANVKSVVTEPEAVFSLILLTSEDAPFTGPELLHAMIENGLKHGEMDIFHRHVNTNGTGEILFSLSNALNPGTFDLSAIDSLSTRALMLFMTLPGPSKPVEAYQTLLSTADSLAATFGAQILDSNRSTFTNQTRQHQIEQVRDFERRELTKKPSA